MFNPSDTEPRIFLENYMYVNSMPADTLAPDVTWHFIIKVTGQQPG